jgi:citrate lyase subunit beta/citryl-CoA lyase
MTAPHPAEVLFDGEAPPIVLPPCDHYAGSEKLMRKSLAKQHALGPVFDLTLDCEDGAEVGHEARHAALVGSIVGGPDNRFGRIGVRIHDYRHPAWRDDVRIILNEARRGPAYITLPKIRSAAQAAEMADYVESTRRAAGLQQPIPIQVLIETHGALAEAQALAAMPAIEALSFGLMDFVSAHHGAIPDAAMRSPGQFEHPLVRRAKLEIAAACHAHGKVPSHNVCTEIRDLAVVSSDATLARESFGYTRMWSIHPDQIAPIVAAFTPRDAEATLAADILVAAQAANWGPIRHGDTLHDRASYRYYWSVLQRAQAAGLALPRAEQTSLWFGADRTSLSTGATRQPN